MNRIHPVEDPKFRGCDGPPVWYLSHPLAPDAVMTFQQNMDHVVKLIALFFKYDVHVTAPYYVQCIALDDNNPDHRRMGLECDCATVKALGRIILSGHKLSTGMECERDVIMNTQSRLGGYIWNLIGYSDDQIEGWLKLYQEKSRDRNYPRPKAVRA